MVAGVKMMVAAVLGCEQKSRAQTKPRVQRKVGAG